jgi:hypothetical protein
MVSISKTVMVCRLLAFSVFNIHSIMIWTHLLQADYLNFFVCANIL